jgi:putative protease
MVNLTKVETQALDYETVFSRLKVINDTEYYIEKMDLDGLQPGVFMPFAELTSIKKTLLFILNGSREYVEPIAVPELRKPENTHSKPDLYVLISTKADLYLCTKTSATICFQLPGSMKNSISEYVDIFKSNKHLIPWFPAILIGNDYIAAVEFLNLLKPERIVTNNSGIAYEAYKQGITWIAGPFMNSINSFSLACLKEYFNCSGAFISNEISKTQMQRIRRPGDFELYYSIFHPIHLMTSRQCLFHQVTGCEKHLVDDTCIENCHKTAAITNLKNETSIIHKSGRNYHTVYDSRHFLNAEIANDLPNLFSGFLIDLSDIVTETRMYLDKAGLINLFENYIGENPDSKKELHELIQPTRNTQYKKGI